MARTIGIGLQNFEDIIQKNVFYIDKTFFIKEWWENEDSVTLITRPRRFGKTLAMSMVETFFSLDYAKRSDLFSKLDIWKEEKYRLLQGTCPVISLSFANVKEATFEETVHRMNQLLVNLYNKYTFLLDSNILQDKEAQFFQSVSEEMPATTATFALHQLSLFLSRYYGQKVIILLDEYDTPMQEAYIHGYWDELVYYMRSMFNATFKTNQYLERAIMTGITRVSKESVFSDLNNLEVITTTSKKYASVFGFTTEEVKEALEEYDLSAQFDTVKRWYDGFCFGNISDIYNPWSILNYLDKKAYAAYWANSSANSLIGTLLQEGNRGIKTKFERLLRGENLYLALDEQVVFSQLKYMENAIWSLLLAGGYLKVTKYELDNNGVGQYELALTNQEVVIMFRAIIREWFSSSADNYNDFIKALLLGDVDAMNEYMNNVALTTFSYFDTGNQPSMKSDPERFYHGFVLGLMVELQDRYLITSNRESGFGRYDIMLEPQQDALDAIIIEFKVFQPRKEKTPEETIQAAHAQIADMKYAAQLETKGIKKDKIRCYAFVFQGKQVWIG